MVRRKRSSVPKRLDTRYIDAERKDVVSRSRPAKKPMKCPTCKQRIYVGDAVSGKDGRRHEDCVRYSTKRSAARADPWQTGNA